MSQAPITEAVIEVRAVLESPWDEKGVQRSLRERLPEYPLFSSQKEFKQEFQLSVSPETPAKQTFRDLGLKGFRLQSADKCHIVQFNKDGFVFSRLRPYAEWQVFVGEALRLWEIYSELAKPHEIPRIGLRFINQVACPLDSFELSDYLRIVPIPPVGLDNLPFAGFLHHETLMVPDYPYMINIVKTLQPPQATNKKGLTLILDIDVFTTEKCGVDGDTIRGYLEEMRWLKNKTFFGSITDSLMEALK